MSAQAVGVFDSGVGGLTVLSTLIQRFPQENFIYLGDTARLPYGTKSPSTIRAYSEQVMNFLVERKVKAIVIACNSASSQVSEVEWKGIPVYSVIQPGASTAVLRSKNKRIGVLGTRATVESAVYTKAIEKLDSSIQVFSKACPLLVPLAEEGWTNDPVTDLIVSRYVQPILENKIDTLILGCTHYPLLKQAIQKVSGYDVSLVDSGDALAQWIEKDFKKGRIKTSPNKSGSIKIYKTDLSSHAEILTRKILVDCSIDSIEQVDLLER